MQAHELQVLVCAGDPVGDTGRAGVAAGQCLMRSWCKNLRRAVQWILCNQDEQRRRHRHASSPRRRDLPLAELLGIVERPRLGRSMKRIAATLQVRQWTPWPS